MRKFNEILWIMCCFHLIQSAQRTKKHFFFFQYIHIIDIYWHHSLLRKLSFQWKKIAHKIRNSWFCALSIDKFQKNIEISCSRTPAFRRKQRKHSLLIINNLLRFQRIRCLLLLLCLKLELFSFDRFVCLCECEREYECDAHSLTIFTVIIGYS